jgi:hypothetical protein
MVLVCYYCKQLKKLGIPLFLSFCRYHISIILLSLGFFVMRKQLSSISLYCFAGKKSIIIIYIYYSKVKESK